MVGGYTSGDIFSVTLTGTLPFSGNYKLDLIKNTFSSVGCTAFTSEPGGGTMYNISLTDNISITDDLRISINSGTC
jgi:hypothetical protein